MCPHVAMHCSDQVALGTMTQGGKPDTAERGPLVIRRSSAQRPKMFSNLGAFRTVMPAAPGIRFFSLDPSALDPPPCAPGLRTLIGAGGVGGMKLRLPSLTVQV